MGPTEILLILTMVGMVAVILLLVMLMRRVRDMENKGAPDHTQAIIDGVNVGEDIFLIETNIGKNTTHIMKQMIEVRSRLSREKRWKQLDEDIDYRPSQLDRDIVNPSQIRTVIRTFKENVFTTLFPRRKEVPKTLILRPRYLV